ncbi:MAG: hypothetical protein COA50_07200 [Flavobacteriaceae bacterium]|nr:MAG: hypothetical protein COA50_07200 [Flavobacteriaceae bacterium]
MTKNMELKEQYSEEERYLRAQKKVKELSGFYWHLFSYIIVNSFISVSKMNENFLNGETFNEAFFDFGTFAVWFFWGIGLFFHGVHVFKDRFNFFNSWEERKIKELMEKEASEFQKKK